jgi:hypothetical protein
VDNVSGLLNVSRERYIPMAGYNHQDICRFANETEGGYTLVVAKIREAADKVLSS